MTIEDQAFRSLLYMLQHGRLEEAKNQWQALPLPLQASARMLQLMGIIFSQEKEFDLAIDYFRRAIKKSPGQAPLYVNLGNAYLELGQQEQAIACYERGMRINPNLAELFYNRGLALIQAKKEAEATKSFRKAVRLNPTYKEAWVELATLYSGQGSWDRAAEAAEKVLRVDKSQIRAWYVKAYVALAAARSDEALHYFRCVLALDPKQSEALLETSFLQLSGEDFEGGWRHYQARWMSASRALLGSISRTSNPKYEPDKGYRRVLVWSEQGLGDDVFFVNMLAALGTWGPELLVTVDPRLLDIMQRSVPGITFKSKLAVLAEDEFDAHLPMGDLGLYLNSPEVIAKRAQQTCFLQPQPEKQDVLRQALTFLKPGEKLCGISWRSKAEKIGAGKSLQLEQLLPILSVSGYAFINLQYGDVSNEIADFEVRHGITVHQVEGLDLFNDIEGLSALISLCDAVVTVSNVTAHLCGAMGQPTCLLRAFSYHTALYYWRNVRLGQNLWYPSVNTMVQSESGAWNEALGQVSEQLQVWR